MNVKEKDMPNDTLLYISHKDIVSKLQVPPVSIEITNIHDNKIVPKR